MPFRKIEFDSPVTLSKCVKTLNWGGNKLIRAGGFRISKEIKLWKTWQIVKDPNMVVDKNCYLATDKGRKIMIIEINPRSSAE